jgi:hypothetical protein
VDRPLSHGSQKYFALCGVLDQIRAHFGRNHRTDARFRFVESSLTRQYRRLSTHVSHLTGFPDKNLNLCIRPLFTLPMSNGHQCLISNVQS